MSEPHRTLDHSPWEDAQAFLLGTALCALGIKLLEVNALITGQTAGLGVFLTYLTPLSFGGWFFVINLPFYTLAWLRMGPRFTVKSFLAVAMVSVLAELFSRTIIIQTLPPWIGGPLAGALIGLGLIVIFRHGASLGGIGILALYLQEKIGFKAGWTQLIFDLVLFAFALLLFAPQVIVWSLLGAIITNVIIATNHRQDRYVAR